MIFLGTFFAWAKEPTSRTDAPTVAESGSPLSIDHILGEFTFAQPQPNTFINGFIKFNPDHTWKMVVHFDNNRDRLTDRHEVFNGTYEVQLTNEGPEIVVLQNGQENESVKEVVFMGGKIKSFSLKGFSFNRRSPDGLFFDHTLNVPTTAKELRVTTTPAGAIVFIEGVRVDGNTPLIIHHPPAGRPISIRIELIDHSTKTDSFELAANESKSVSYSLVSGEAELWVATYPWTKVIIDGKYYGNAPIQLDNLSAGTHQVRLVNTGAEIDDTFEVELPEGGIVKKVLRYNGKLNVFVGREVEIVDRAGKVLGKAPIEGLELHAGNHTLRLVDIKTKEMKIILVRIRLNQVATINEKWEDLQSWKDK